MRLLYTLLIYLLLPFAFFRLWWRGRKNPLYRQRWRERLGYIPSHNTAPVWIHAVSLGESIAAVPLIRELLAQKWPVVVTTMTITGASRVQELFGNTITHFYLPYDTVAATTRFLKRLKPHLGIILETEIWPNLYAAAATLHIPLVLANARLSAISQKRYARFLSLFTPALQSLRHIAAQTELDASRFIALGAPPSTLSIMGNIKFDSHIPQDVKEKGHELKSHWQTRPTWIAASTHQGEEDIVLQAFIDILKQVPNALLILVPRHPERFDTVAALLEHYGLSYVRRSQAVLPDPKIKVFLGDTMGELLSLYAASDVAFVGGSLMPIGGHNILEPAALGIPAIMGPYTFKCTEIMRIFEEASAYKKVSSQEELTQAVIGLFTHPTECTKITEAANTLVQANRGALQRLYHILPLYTQSV